MSYAMALDNSWDILSEEEMYDVNGGAKLASITLTSLQCADIAAYITMGGSVVSGVLALASLPTAGISAAFSIVSAMLAGLSSGYFGVASNHKGMEISLNVKINWFSSYLYGKTSILR